MITTTSEGRAGLSEREFAGRTARAIDAVWSVIASFFAGSFRAAHQAPYSRHCHCDRTGR